MSDGRVRHAMYGLALLLLALTGCCSTPPGDALPRTTGLTDGQILDLLSQRADQAQRVMSSGTMRLRTPDGESVKLDVALLAEGDNRLRLRAWKLGRAVFDLTRDGSDLWLWHAKQEDGGDTGEDFTLPDAKQLSTGWRLVSGQIIAAPRETLTTGDPLTVTFRLSDTAEPGATARLTIDRDTQTVMRVDILDDQGNASAVYTPARYRLINAVPWPTRMTLRSEGLSLDITLDEVELNGTLPPGAFSPPRDARKLP